MFDIDQFLKSKLSSLSLIHNETIVYDLNFDQINKNDLLKNIQFWKDWFVKNNIKKIVIQEYLSLDTIAITYACLESNVSVYSCRKNYKRVEQLSQTVDAVLIGRSCKELFIENNKKYFIIDHLIRGVNLPEYCESFIDLDFVFLIGETSGSSTGKPKQIIHTAQTFIAAAKCCTFFYYVGQRFSALPNLNHSGMAANMVLAPTLAGCKIYTISDISELMMLCKRNTLNTIGLFVNQANYIQKMFTLLANNNFPRAEPDFEGIEMLTGGTSLGPTLADWFFSKNGKRIRSLIGNNEVLMPVFVHDVYNKSEDFLKRKLGNPCPFVEYKIDENDNLWVKTPSISKYVKVSSDGYYNTKDLVVRENNELLYKGRKKINGRFILDLHDSILKVTAPSPFAFDDFIVHYDSDVNKIIIISHKLSVLESVKNLTNEIGNILLDFGCDPNFETMQTDGTDGIKYVLRDPNLIDFRDRQDYGIGIKNV